MRVTVLVLDGVFDSGLAVLLDTLATAHDLSATEGRGRTGFDVTVAGLRQRVTTGHGMRVPVTRVDPQKRPDVVLVPALGAKTPEAIATALERAEVAECAALLRDWNGAGVRVAGACTATFVLAASGILDGGSATTTWWLAPSFRERFPQVELDDARMIVESGRVVTAGAALAHVDLALWLVRRQSAALAHATARYLVFDARPSQSVYVMPDHLAHADPIVERFEAWAARHLTDCSLADAARSVGTSERTLERRTRAVLGKTPLAYVQDLRVELAVHRLRTTKDSLEQIARHVGYEDGVTLGTLLRKKTGRTVRELRDVVM
jgi:transcriptional regulator GlxA family with amidase domain